MKKILLFGSGRSSPSLILYLSSMAEQGILSLTIADSTLPPFTEKKNVFFVQLSIESDTKREQSIQEADIVISLLPPALHAVVARDCLRYSKHFLTASYVTPELQEMHEEAVSKNLLFLMESGLDPGIDHLSAMREIHEIQKKGGTITSFKSYTGGLVAPESDSNPWNYKITWNPRNVVLAGQGTVKYLHDGVLRYLPYHRLFSTTEKISIPGFGNFEGYPNRDSLKYIATYGLSNCSTFLRGTLRRPGFCDAWNLLVQLGITDDSFTIENASSLTWKEFTWSFLSPKRDKKINHLLGALINKGPGATEVNKLKWLGLLDETPIGISSGTPAQLLQKRLEEKLRMLPEDKDMIAMQHLFEYELEGKKYKRISSLVLKGENSTYTAMAKTVGLPLGIAAYLCSKNSFAKKGVCIPIEEEFYSPMLEELKKQGIEFTTTEFSLSKSSK